MTNLSALLGRRSAALGRQLIADIVVLALKTLTLLLESLDILLTLDKLLLETANLTGLTSFSELVGLLAVDVGAFVALDLLFETEDVEDHHVSAVEDQGEEEREAAEIHVALGVELAGLDFHALVADDSPVFGSVRI